LFRRILSNPDFRAARIDTGFLDRLLKQKDQSADIQADAQTTEVAVIAAGMFAALGPAAAGAGERVPNGSVDKPGPVSKWKAAAQREALR
jgi:acetyl-CoA carboxylase biotin carboxylase subunit